MARAEMLTLNRIATIGRFLAAVSFLLGQGVIAQERISLSRQERLSDPVYMAWVSHESVGACVRCHVVGPSDGEIEGGSLSSYSRRREMMHWLRRDKHAIARRRVEPLLEADRQREGFKLVDWLEQQQVGAIERYAKEGVEIELQPRTIDRASIAQWLGRSNELSRRICDKLYGDGVVESDAGYERFRRDCLTCHGGYQNGAIGDAKSDSIGMQKLGIDCLYCHQNGENATWVLAHQDPTKWRLKSPVEKLAGGMNDLADTSNQANLCFDCHIGNRNKGMFVTHEMYAAGHPPLPSVELQTFCENMPMHWQSPGQLYENAAGESDRERYFATNYPGLVADAAQKGLPLDEVQWDARKVFVGALEAKRRHLDLMIQSADSGRWADYSLYDCAACHHELVSNSARQARTFPKFETYFGPPGRPRQHEWTLPLLLVAYKIDSRSFERSKKLHRELDACFGSRPFGDPHEVRAKSLELRSHLKQLVQSVEDLAMDELQVNRIIKSLATIPTDALITYDSARQIAWAIQSLGQVDDDASIAVIRSIGDPKTSGVDTTLPAGRDRFIYPQSLLNDLRNRSRYDPMRFANHLKAIGSLGNTR